MNSCTYILSMEGCKDAILVDCGDVEPINEYLSAKGLELKAILLTHTHFDHIYGLNSLVEQHLNSVVYTSEQGKIGLTDIRLNFSRYHVDQDSFVYKYDNIVVIEDGTELPFENVITKVLYTPGHDWSCCSYIIDDYLFTGDSYIPGYEVRLHFPKSNNLDAAVSLKRLKEIAKDKVVLAGHPDAMEIRQSRNTYISLENKI